MPPRKTHSPQDELQETVTRLQEQLRVLCDIANEIRDELSWAIRNDRAIVVPVGNAVADDNGEQLAAFIEAVGKARDEIIAAVNRRTEGTTERPAQGRLF